MVLISSIASKIQENVVDAHTCQPSQSDTGVLPPANNSAANQFFPQCRNSSLEEGKILLRRDHNSSEVDMMQHRYGSENKEQNIKENRHHLYTRQRMYGALLSVIRPHLSSDKDMQIQSLHTKYLKNEIQTIDYKRHLENIVGDDQMIEQAWRTIGIQSPLAGHNSQTTSGQFQKQSQTSIQQENQVSIRVKSTTNSLETGNMVKIPPRKASRRQKRPEDALDNASSLTRNNSTTPSSGQKWSKDALGTASSLSSKRQKISGPFLDHSIEPLNDLTAHSGVNLKEEEDQFFSAPKEESRTSEFTKSVVREEEESECKKQKVSGTILDHSTESLDDVTAYCGINLMEEEEQLFAGPKEQSRTSEAIRHIVQEEEERLILQKIPFQKKMENIISKYGIKNISKDVEHCVSLYLEERTRGLINEFVRLSKQRVGIERLRHQTVITSDVGHQILLMNQKAKKDLEKKQAEEFEELWKNNEAHKNTGSYGERGKEECNTINLKESKHEDFKIEKANIAARMSVGGDDMLSKWRLMAEKARENCKGADSASTVENRSPTTATTSGTKRKFGRNAALMPHRKIERTVSVKDVISVLEREPQMSRSTLVYRLYEQVMPH